MISIRRNLTRSLLVTLVIVLLVGGAAAYFVARAFLVAQFDDGLRNKLRTLAALTEFEHGAVRFEFTRELMPEFEAGPRAEFFQIWLEDGSVLDRSQSLHGGELAHRSGPEGEEFVFDVVLPDARHGRAVSLTFRPHLSEEVLIEEEGELPGAGVLVVPPVDMVVARSVDEVDTALASFLYGIALMDGALLIAVIVIVRASVRRGLAPLGRLATEVDSIDEESLDHRVVLERQPVELAAVSGKLNELLSRLQGAFDSKKRFNQAAAHELRTPIAELRSLAEVALKWPEGRATSEWVDDVREVREIACQMEALVKALLAISRAERGNLTASGARDLVELGRAVEAVLEPQEPSAREKRIELALDVPEGLTVRTDGASLAVVLRNLLENALEYAPAGSRVDLLAELRNGRAALHITNQDRTLAAEDLPRLFEPFWRKDESRTDSHHSGLGLAVAQTLVRALGLELDVAQRPPGHVTFTLTFPQSMEPGTFPPRAERRSVRA